MSGIALDEAIFHYPMKTMAASDAARIRTRRLSHLLKQVSIRLADTSEVTQQKLISLKLSQVPHQACDEKDASTTRQKYSLLPCSSIVQTRAYERTDAGRRRGLRWAVTDSTIALCLTLFVNAAILITAAAVFHTAGRTDVVDIEMAHELLSPMLGVGIASTLFAVALLASGVNSTVTATLAGQIVMEGFLHFRIPAWARRLTTRGLAIVPVVIVTALYGERGTSELLVFSQVILSMQLPMAVIPLVRFVTDPSKMGSLVVGRWLAVIAWSITAIIVMLNIKLLVTAAQQWL